MSRKTTLGRRVAAAVLLLLAAGVTSLSFAQAGDDAPAPAAPASPTSPAALEPVPLEIIDALKGLKAPAEPARRKVYALIEEKGDARLIPALKAFAGGTLQLRGDRLVFYGPPKELPDRRVYPLHDAVTGEPLRGADGVAIEDDKLNLSGAFRKPLTASARDAVMKLIATLSLLSPDPRTRITSIREAGERAARVFVDPEDGKRVLAQWSRAKIAITKYLASNKGTAAAGTLTAAVAAVDAGAADKAAKLTDPAPGEAALTKTVAALTAGQTALKATTPAATTRPATNTPGAADASDVDEVITVALAASASYRGTLGERKKRLDELPRYAAALKRQVDAGAGPEFTPALREATASLDVVLGDAAARAAAVKTLGELSTGRATNMLRKVTDAARRTGDGALVAAVAPALKQAQGYQSRIRFAKQTFAGLSDGSILVLLALGLSIIFGLMGVINMAHGEFMMVGAFTTYVVSELFKTHLPGWFDYYPIAAVPAAFLVAGLVGLLVETTIVRHLYGRPLETLLATWGVGLILIQAVRIGFGDTLSVTAPRWMTGSFEVVSDLDLPWNRIYISVYCAICIAAVWFLVNRTKLGLLLRATTQNREMAAALGVSTRRIDAVTFSVGAGLAGLAGVAVPLYNKINPQIGTEYIVESFMVVVVGGVGKLAGAIWAGFGLGFIRQYLEPALQYVPAFDSSASVVSQVIVLALVVAFLQWRPAGLFPPKGRLADA